MILSFEVSIHTTSLVKIDLAVSEIWALPVFAAQLRTARLDYRNFLKMILAHGICIHTPILVEISPAVAEIWALPVFVGCSALRGSTTNASAT